MGYRCEDFQWFFKTWEPLLKFQVLCMDVQWLDKRPLNITLDLRTSCSDHTPVKSSKVHQINNFKKTRCFNNKIEKKIFTWSRKLEQFNGFLRMSYNCKKNNVERKLYNVWKNVAPFHKKRILVFVYWSRKKWYKPFPIHVGSTNVSYCTWVGHEILYSYWKQGRIQTL